MLTANFRDAQGDTNIREFLHRHSKLVSFVALYPKPAPSLSALEVRADREVVMAAVRKAS